MTDIYILDSSHQSVSGWFVLLTLLRSWGARRNFLVGVDGGLRCQAVELFPADQVDLLEVLHLLL